MSYKDENWEERVEILGDPALLKTCRKCGATKPRTTEFFYVHRGSKKGILYLQSWCKSCSNTRGSESETRYAWKLRTVYNLDPVKYEEMCLRGCAICGSMEPGGRGRFHVDHDHGCCPGKSNSCGKCIRGVLCHKCNTGLGSFNDSHALLRLAAYYVEGFR